MTSPTSPIASASVACTRCGYDLAGTPIGGACPECAQPVAESLRQGAPEKTSPRALTCMILGIVSLAACCVLGPLVIASYFGAMREIESGSYTAGSRTIAKAGLVLGMIATAILLIMLFVIFVPTSLQG